MAHPPIYSLSDGACGKIKNFGILILPRQADRRSLTIKPLTLTAAYPLTGASRLQGGRNDYLLWGGEWSVSIGSLAGKEDDVAAAGVGSAILDSAKWCQPFSPRHWLG